MRPANLLRNDSVAPSQTARILLPAFEWMFGVQAFDRRGKLVKWFRDPTSVQYVAEVMVSAGATEVLLDASFIDRRAVTALLAQPLQRRVKFFRSRRTHQFMSRLLEPLGAELGLTFSHGGVAMPNGRESDPRTSAALAVHADLPILLDGIRHRSMVDVDIKRLRRSVRRLRLDCRDPINRSHMSALEPIVSAYTIDVPGIRVVPGKHNELVSNLRDFVDDVEYEQLSHDYFRLGIPSLCRQAVLRIRPALRRFLASRKCNAVLGYATSVLRAATRLELPDSVAAAALFEPGYLPPLIDTAPYLRSAHAEWARHMDSTERTRMLDAFSQVFRHDPQSKREDDILTFRKSRSVDGLMLEG